MADALSTDGKLTALNTEVRFGVSSLGGIGIQIQGTFSGTITFEASIQGQDFTAFRVTPANSSTPTSTATAAGLFTGSVVGYKVIRARMSSYVSGAATIFMLADQPAPGGAGGGGGSGTDVNLIEVGGSSIALGQTTMANSLPVVIASNQNAIPITGSITASNPSVGPTEDPVPAEATYIGFLTEGGDLTGLAAANLDYDTNGGTVPQTVFGIALPGSGGPVAGGTAANPLQIGDAGGAITVDGTVTANAGTNLNTSALALEATLSSLNGKVTAVNTGAVVVASSALPTGASTAAKQPALGTAGTASADVITVQGIVSMTPLLVTPAANSAVNVAQINGVTPLMGAGNTGTGSPRVTIATDQAVLPVQGNVADDAASSGNPVFVGGFAKPPDGTDPSSVSAENDRASFITDLNRRQYVNTVHPRFGHKHLDGSTAYTDESLVSDPGDGFQTVITNIIVGTNAATTMSFFLEEGSTKIFGPYALEAVQGRGFCSGPIFLPVTASTAVTITTSASIAQGIDIDYFIQAVP